MLSRGTFGEFASSLGLDYVTMIYAIVLIHVLINEIAQAGVYA